MEEEIILTKKHCLNFIFPDGSEADDSELTRYTPLVGYYVFHAFYPDTIFQVVSRQEDKRPEFQGNQWLNIYLVEVTENIPVLHPELKEKLLELDKQKAFFIWKEKKT